MKKKEIPPGKMLAKKPKLIVGHKSDMPGAKLAAKPKMSNMHQQMMELAKHPIPGEKKIKKEEIVIIPDNLFSSKELKTHAKRQTKHKQNINRHHVHEQIKARIVKIKKVPNRPAAEVYVSKYPEYIPVSSSSFNPLATEAVQSDKRHVLHKELILNIPRHKKHIGKKHESHAGSSSSHGGMDPDEKLARDLSKMFEEVDKIEKKPKKARRRRSVKSFKKRKPRPAY